MTRNHFVYVLYICTWFEVVIIVICYCDITPCYIITVCPRWLLCNLGVCLKHWEWMGNQNELYFDNKQISCNLFKIKFVKHLRVSDKICHLCGTVWSWRLVIPQLGNQNKHQFGVVFYAWQFAKKYLLGIKKIKTTYVESVHFYTFIFHGTEKNLRLFPKTAQMFLFHHQIATNVRYLVYFLLLNKPTSVNFFCRYCSTIWTCRRLSRFP